MDICGNIYVSKDIRNFSLRCTLCEKAVSEWNDFVCHIQRFHNFAEDDELNESEVELTEVWIEDRGEADFEGNNGNITEEEIKHETTPIGEEQKEKDVFLMESNDGIECTNWPMEECQMPEAANTLDANSSSDSGSDQEDNNSNKDSEMEENSAGMIPETSTKLNPTFYVRSYSTTHFIELYKASPCLWNPNDDNYQNSPVRLEAQQEIIDKMKQSFNIDLTQRSLKGAIMKIRRQYHNTLQMKTKTRAKINAVVQEHFDKCSFLSVFDDSPDDITTESNTMKFLVFEEVNEDTLSFIDVYASYPALYDHQHINYTSSVARHMLQGEMAKRLGAQYNVEYTGLDVQNDIAKLRSWYYETIAGDQHPNTDSPQSQAAANAEKLYIDKLSSFMPPTLEKRQEKLQRVYCELCNKGFGGESSLNHHKYKEHSVGEKPFKCPDCDRSFQVLATFRDHQRRTHMEKSLQCDYCERRFPVNGDLQRHLKTHTGERPYICEWCGKDFATVTLLKTHTVAIHTKVRAYKCTMCPKDFLKNVDLKDHIKAHLNIRDKICETCGKGFTNCHSLIRHRQIHSAVKKYSCKLCDLKFHQFVGLNSHMKRTHKLAKITAK